jgi:hypothetical protein
LIERFIKIVNKVFDKVINLKLSSEIAKEKNPDYVEINIMHRSYRKGKRINHSSRSLSLRFQKGEKINLDSIKNKIIEAFR